MYRSWSAHNRKYAIAHARYTVAFEITEKSCSIHDCGQKVHGRFRSDRHVVVSAAILAYRSGAKRERPAFDNRIPQRAERRSRLLSLRKDLQVVSQKCCLFEH